MMWSPRPRPNSSFPPAPSLPAVVGAVSGCWSLLWVLLLSRRWSPYTLRNALPSDLFKRGSFGRHGLQVKRGDEYAYASEKNAVHALGRLYGCHHCGRRIDVDEQRVRMLLHSNQHSRSERLDTSRQAMTRGRKVNVDVNAGTAPTATDNGATTEVLGFVADHIPPNKFNSNDGAQSFFPQCPQCSSKQSHAVRLNQRTLVSPHWSRLTWSDAFVPVPILLLPFLPALHSILQLVQMALESQ